MTKPARRAVVIQGIRRLFQMFPLILVFCIIGAYSMNTSVAEVLIMIFFGFAGYVMKKFNYEAAPLILALVLSLRSEGALRRSLLLEHGDLTIFFTRPISAAFLVIAITMILVPLIPKLRKKSALLPREEDPA